MLYEKFKLSLQKYKFVTEFDKSSDGKGFYLFLIFSVRSVRLNPIEYLIVASAAKLMASLITYPHEVVRTRLREQRGTVNSPIKYKGFIHCIKVIMKEEGWKALYSGMGAHLVRVVPNAAIIFLTYETVVKILSSGTPSVS